MEITEDALTAPQVDACEDEDTHGDDDDHKSRKGKSSALAVNATTNALDESNVTNKGMPKHDASLCSGRNCISEISNRAMEIIP